MFFMMAVSVCGNYKAELRKELGVDKKVGELLKFYGVE